MSDKIPVFILMIYFDLFMNLDDDSPGYIFENDIVVYDDIHDNSIPDAVGDISRLWEKNSSEVIIPFTYPEGVTSHQLQEIEKAIDEFHKKTCIR